MFGDILNRPFSLKASQYFISALSARTVGLSVACFLVIYLALSPFYLTFYGRYMMHNLFIQGQLVYEIIGAGDGHKPQLYPVVDTHAMRGLRITSADTAPYYIWLGGYHDASDIQHRLDLASDDQLSQIWTSAQVWFGDAGRFVAIQHSALSNISESNISESNISESNISETNISETVPTGATTIEVIALQNSIQARLRAFFFKVSGFVFLISLLMVLVLRGIMTRQLLHSFDQLFVMFYGKSLDRVARFNIRDEGLRAAAESLQTRVAQHINEQARLATLGEGAGRFAHDMRNLLTSLQLIADRLATLKDAAAEKLSHRLTASVDQAVILCEWAARYSSDKRNGANAIETQMQPLVPIIDEMLTLIRFHDPQQIVELSNTCEPHLMVHADKTLLFRALYNISLNAVQAMQVQKGRGLLRITARADDQGCDINIIDTGPGIPAKNIESLFVSTPQHNRKSIGLGVRIATELIDWHGGRLELVRSDAGGTHFSIHIPSRLPTDATVPVAESHQIASPEAKPVQPSLAT